MPRHSRSGSSGRQATELAGVALAVLFLTLPGTSAVAAQESDWRQPSPEHVLYLQLESGWVAIELAPDFAPRHVANIQAMAKAGLFNGATVVRSQDNYVAQWQIRSDEPDTPPPAGVEYPLEAEFEMDGSMLPFVALPDPDTYAPEVGFLAEMPVGRDPATNATWIAHCYGSVGVARGNDPDSGSGSQLYAVTGNAPRHLDRNLTMVGRVLYGMEHLSTLPRGTESLGFYATPEEQAPILAGMLAADLPESERLVLEVMRTESQAFRDFISGRRSRTEDFFVYPTDRIGLCNALPPVRVGGGGAG